MWRKNRRQNYKCYCIEIHGLLNRLRLKVGRVVVVERGGQLFGVISYPFNRGIKPDLFRRVPPDMPAAEAPELVTAGGVGLLLESRTINLGSILYLMNWHYITFINLPLQEYSRRMYIFP